MGNIGGVEPDRLENSAGLCEEKVGKGRQLPSRPGQYDVKDLVPGPDQIRLFRGIGWYRFNRKF